MNNNNGIVIGILCVVILIFGFFLGRFTAGTDMVSVIAPGASQTETNDAAEAVSVESAQMSAGQRQMLEAMGMDPDSVTITPEMVACAEAKIGAARVEEIKNGATPSFGEGATLLACYKS